MQNLSQPGLEQGVNKALQDICQRISTLEKRVGDQSQQLNTLENSIEETGNRNVTRSALFRVAVLHESVVVRERVMEARSRICSDRVFLIEAAAGRKDDVYNALETLFKNSKKGNERLTIIEEKVNEMQSQIFDSGWNMTKYQDPACAKVVEKRGCYQGHPQRKGKRLVPPSQIVTNICKELYENISLPGVRFIGQGKNWIHRYLWVILHLTTFSISFNYIKEAYDTWQNSPVVLSLNNSLTRVADVTFPAVTLCSLPSVSNDYVIAQQVSKCFLCTNGSADDFCTLSDECNEVDILALASALSLCSCLEDHLTPEQINLMDEIFNNNLTQLDQFSMEIKKMILPQCNPNHLSLGVPPHVYYSCEHVITSLMDFTDTPVCVTFNSLCPEDLYRDNVVPAIVDERQITCKMSATGLTWNTDTMMILADKNDSVPLYRDKKLEIMFKRPNNIRVETCNDGHDANSKIGLHHPGELPMEENTRFYSFRAERDLNMYVSPSLITAQPSLRQYEPALRGCYFAHERNLTLFRFYTRNNCQMECRANCSMAVCNCVPNFLPRTLFIDMCAK